MKVAEFLLGSIPLPIQLYADLYRKTDFESTMFELESEFNVPKVKTYDFIIVGGGSAGCLLAGRLSEFFNVLMLEAGGTPPPEYYGKDGPIQVHAMIVPMLDVWFNAARELGYPTGDPNAYQREGFSSLNMAISKGQRSSSYVEYIKPYESLRDSLTVIRYANVLEILLDDDKKAYGVAYMRHGFPQIAHAHKEIILSASSYSSPLLLMKSGIGPKNILNAAEIPVKVPLEAIGKNLGEHTGVSLTDFSVNDTSLFPKMSSADIERLLEDYQNGEGALVTRGAAGWTNVQGFFVSSKARFDWPDIWITLRTSVSIDGDEQLIRLSSYVARPLSKGVLTLDTEKYKAGVRDDVELALIDYKLLTHPDDVEVLLEGIKFIFRIIETEAFKSINFTYNGVPVPACSAFTYLSDDYWRCRIQQITFTVGHMVGTCSMGPDSTNSTMSVVDTKFRVKGVSNLRTVDASVIPEITNSNINAPVMMLAEKAADDIINFYQATETTSTVSPPTNPVSTSTNSINTTPSSSTSVLVDTNKLFIVSVITFVIHVFN